MVETPSPSASVWDGAQFTGDWYDEDGEVVSEQSFFKVAARRGPEHCEWQSAVVLTVVWPPGTEYDPEASGYGFRQYLRDPGNVIPAVADDDEQGRSRGDLDTDVELPAAANDSGLYTEGAELWFGPDEGDAYAYLVTPDHTERWPRQDPPQGCD